MWMLHPEMPWNRALVGQTFGTDRPGILYAIGFLALNMLWVGALLDVETRYSPGHESLTLKRSHLLLAFNSPQASLTGVRTFEVQCNYPWYQKCWHNCLLVLAFLVLFLAEVL